MRSKLRYAYGQRFLTNFLFRYSRIESFYRDRRSMCTDGMVRYVQSGCVFCGWISRKNLITIFRYWADLFFFCAFPPPLPRLSTDIISTRYFAPNFPGGAPYLNAFWFSSGGYRLLFFFINRNRIVRVWFYHYSSWFKPTVSDYWFSNGQFSPSPSDSKIIIFFLTFLYTIGLCKF